jgi:hypothetical protein
MASSRLEYGQRFEYQAMNNIKWLKKRLVGFLTFVMLSSEL